MLRPVKRARYCMYHERQNIWTHVARASPAFEQHSVHGEAQHGEHCGPHARSQPEGGALRVGLAHMSVEQKEAGRSMQRQRVRKHERLQDTCS